MTKKRRFSFQQHELPYISLMLTYQTTSLQVEAMLDSGSTINVLPYDIGQRLGATWENQTTTVQLAGNLRAVEARGILLKATIDGFLPVSLAFAWAKSSNVPLILGHANFFMEFDVCFYRADNAFEISSRNQD
ncbi:hypothetical protein NIES4071_54730 [Calothrix sp. NIES-4071]|nr:hypothetical protein NIES4071_54730 [Calothrix sp. NIES-4071]BAZ59781.1 hypothetical protein NIES4105_54680 [Calothrix sp. NIES-4105]